MLTPSLEWLRRLRIMHDCREVPVQKEHIAQIKYAFDAKEERLEPRSPFANAAQGLVLAAKMKKRKKKKKLDVRLFTAFLVYERKL